MPLCWGHDGHASFLPIPAIVQCCDHKTSIVTSCCQVLSLGENELKLQLKNLTESNKNFMTNHNKAKKM